MFGKATTEDFFKMLSMQKTSYIPRLLPAELTIANKPGDLDAVRNDAGIVFVPGRPFAIAVMTTFARDELDAEQSIARIALPRGATSTASARARRSGVSFAKGLGGSHRGL